MDFYDDFDNINNKPIVKQIDMILEEEKSYYTIDDILKGLFHKFNITHNDIRDIIKSNIMKKEKCKLCYYFKEYTYNQHILRCNSCNHVNFCKECYRIINFDSINKYSKKNTIYKLINCDICNERLNIDVCQKCESSNCFGCL
jgi:hypothetical protein